MDEETKPKLKAAKDNPWYKLATYNGVPAAWHVEIAVKNRVTWNRWMACRIPDDLRAALLEKGHTHEELTPFPEDESRAIGSQLGISPAAGIVDFSDTEFEALYAGRFVFYGAISFAGATLRNAHFSNATFSSSSPRFHNADFSSAIFSGDAFFAGATFSSDAVFMRATLRNANFSNATLRNANFSNATFSSNAIFSNATFGGDAFFNNATFGGRATFGGPTAFSGNADFSSATFSGRADFSSARFVRDAVFTNAKMEGVTVFDNARFDSPPECSNAKMHDGTTWHDVRWPATPSNVPEARAYLGAYARLKLEMDRLKKHSDELDFFALEQQCRRVVDGFWKGLPIAVYGFLSDYGRSYVRPLLLLAVTVFIGIFLFATHFVGFWKPLLSDLAHTGQAIAVSFANTFGVLGIRKDFIDLQALQPPLPNWLIVVSIVQTILGIAFLFLFGLGIRNRFRMK